MSHYAVHIPFDEDRRFTGRYRGKYDGLLKAGLNENESRYAALVEGMDKSLGDIMDYLSAHPEVAENTVILFMSDNGGLGLGNVRQGPPDRAPNHPARGGKGSAFMGGVREPMIVSWPGVTQAGTVCRQPVMIEDFFPTILDMAGIGPVRTYQHVDGRSFAGVLRNGRKVRKDRVIVWHFPNLWDGTQDREEGYGAYSAVLQGDWHLIYTWETGMTRLYNIRNDIAERHDLAGKKPGMVRRLTAVLTDYLKQRNAQRPSDKATGTPLPYPDRSL